MTKPSAAPPSEYTRNGMTAQLTDFLSAHVEHLADALSRATGEPISAANGNKGRGTRQLLNAVLVALTADDLKPLITYYELDGAKTGSGLDQRLDQALDHLAELRRIATRVAASEKMDASNQLSLVQAAADELGSIGRRLAGGCVHTLSGQLASASSSSTAKGTNLSITMHELRRPLTILNSYGQLLSTGMLGQLPETAMVAIEGITASTEMMVRMVNALAEVSRLEDPDDQLNLEVMSVEEIVSAAVDHVSMEAKLRDTSIEVDVDKEVLIRGDRRRLSLALTNMVGNAVKHGPPGTRIHVTARGDEAGAHFLVRDEGQGFPPEDAAHLFDKYFRSVAERQRKVPGSGLGLFIVRTVAERHGGSVSARSEPGKGAEFEMIVPVHKG